MQAVERVAFSDPLSIFSLGCLWSKELQVVGSFEFISIRPEYYFPLEVFSKGIFFIRGKICFYYI